MDPYLAADEIARLGLEAARLSSRNGGGSVSNMAGRLSAAQYGQGSRPEYDHAALAARDTGFAGLSHADVEEAASELAERSGYSFEDIMHPARSRAAGWSAEELALSMAEMADDLLGLSAGYGDDMISLSSSISQEERRE